MAFLVSFVTGGNGWKLNSQFKVDASNADALHSTMNGANVESLVIRKLESFERGNDTIITAEQFAAKVAYLKPSPVAAVEPQPPAESVGNASTPLQFRRVFGFRGGLTFGENATTLSVAAFSVDEAFAAARQRLAFVRLASIDGVAVQPLTAWVATHYPADVREIDGERLRVATAATTADGAACSAVETIPATFAAAQRWLGY